jgi:large subunit ribosomal protein L3
MFKRAPGSIGNSAWPSRVIKGKRLPGQMGNKTRTVKNLLVVKVDEENNLLYIRGAVPGSKDSYVALRRAKRG